MWFGEILIANFILNFTHLVPSVTTKNRLSFNKCEMTICILFLKLSFFINLILEKSKYRPRYLIMQLESEYIFKSASFFEGFIKKFALIIQRKH